MPASHLSRRTILRGLGATIALPLLDVMSTALTAQTQCGGGRLAYLYFPNGIPRGSWHPQTPGPDGQILELNEWMNPRRRG